MPLSLFFTIKFIVHYIFQIRVELTSPLEVSIVEGEMETVEFCFTVTELNDLHILRYFRIESLPRSARGEYRKKFICAQKV